MKRLYYVLAIIATGTSVLPSVRAAGGFSIGLAAYGATQHVEADVRQAGGIYRIYRIDAGQTATIDLYVDPDKTDKTDRTDRSVEPDGSKVNSDLHDIERETKAANAEAYPSLYRRKAADGIILIFGFPTCAPCHMQRSAIPQNYRVLKVDKDKSDIPGGPTWRALMKAWDIDQRIKVMDLPYPLYPTTVIVEQGLPTKIFYAYKPWRIIEPHAKKAKSNDEKTHTPNRRRNRGWFFNRNRYSERGRLGIGTHGRWSRYFDSRR